ncbi:MAG: tetratricopeptide repeat protein [Bryobacteraceae bacterium]
MILRLAICALLLRPSDAPKLPLVDTSNFSPAIKAQIEVAEAEAKAHPHDARLIGSLGMVLHAYRQYEGAAMAYSRAFALEPQNFDWASLLGVAELEQGQFDLAAKTFQLALAIRPDELSAQLHLAQCLISIPDSQAAERMYKQIVKAHPNCPQAWYGLGRTQAAKGDHVSAAASFTQACNLFPQYGAAQFALAGEFRKLDKPSEADLHLALYAKNSAIEPPLQDPLAQRVEQLNQSSTAHLQRAAELESAGRLDAAIREHEVVLESDPNNVQAHINLISLYGRVGDTTSAKQHFDAAIKLSPNRPDAWYNYGVLLFSQQQYSEAEEAFHRALSINPNYAEAHNNLGATYERERRMEEAASEFRAAITDRPDYPLARFHLARILVNDQKYEEAIQQLLRALQPEEENTPVYTYALAAAYARSGDHKKALQYYREAHDRAIARGQSQLLTSIDRDLNMLEGRK